MNWSKGALKLHTLLGLTVVYVPFTMVNDISMLSAL